MVSSVHRPGAIELDSAMPLMHAEAYPGEGSDFVFFLRHLVVYLGFCFR